MKNKGITYTLRDRLLLCLLPLLLMIILRSFKLNGEADTRIIMRLMLTCTALYCGYSAYKGKLTAEKLIFLILLVGIILRSGYTIYTHAFVRGYDIGIADETGVGHWGYLDHIMKGELPQSNEYQFYQPPFYYMLSGVFIKAAMILRHSSTWGDFMYMAQTVSCTASSIGLVMLTGIMDELKIDKKTQIIPALLTAVYPAQILTAGRMNNDAVVFMFMILSLYFTVRWAKEQKLSSVIGIALSIGLGMMTKINCGIVALITAPVMLYSLYKRIREKNNVRDIIIQLEVFAIIVFPLGLWYPIRNLIRFNQPLGYVHLLGEGSVVYTGGASFADRWIKIPFNFIKAPYMNMGDDTSVWMALIKTGVHGEFSYDGLSQFLAWSLDYAHILLLILCIVSVAAVMLRSRSESKPAKYACLSVWLIQAISYIAFNVSYPYSCSADFRYVLLWQPAAAVFVGFFTDICERRGYSAAGVGAKTAVLLFSALSIMHF